MKTMNNEELAHTTGGVVWWVPVGIAVLAGAIVKDWSDFKEGIKEGWNAYN